jgi:hypothetical protein
MNANGSWHEGEYQNDKRHGNGVEKYASGNKCEGKWCENELQSFVVSYANGKTVSD